MNQQASTSQPSDEELMRAIRAGDRRAAFELDRRWRPRIVGLARSILQNDGLAEDAAQDALWRVFLNLDRYDDSRPFEPWILKIVGNVARDLRRKLDREKAGQPTQADDELPKNLADPSTPAIDALASQEEIEALEACKEGLSERSRTVVTLFASGLSDREIGEVLDLSKAIPKATVQGWRHGALEQLGQCMASKGFT